MKSRVFEGGLKVKYISEQAVIREVKEEIGITYEVERLAFVRECMYHSETALSVSNVISWNFII